MEIPSSITRAAFTAKPAVSLVTDAAVEQAKANRDEFIAGQTVSHPQGLERPAPFQAQAEPTGTSPAPSLEQTAAGAVQALIANQLGPHALGAVDPRPAGHALNASSGESSPSLPVEYRLKYGPLLEEAAARHPEVKDPIRLAQLACELVPADDLSREEKVTELHRAAVQAASKTNRLAEIALKLADRKFDFDSPFLRSGVSELALYKSALKAEQTPSSFVSDSVLQASPEDRDFLQQRLVRDLFPDRYEQIASAVSFSSKEQTRELRSFLSALALEKPPLADPALILELADRAESDKLKSSLLQTTAKNLAKGDARARFLVDVADEKQSDGNSKFSDSTREVLFRAALEPELSGLEIYRKAAKNLSDIGANVERLELAQRLIPETVERVADLTFHSSLEDSAKHRSLLLKTALAHPELEDPARLVQAAVEELDDFGEQQETAVSLLESVAKQLAPTHPRAKFALELVHDSRGQRNFRALATARAVFRAAFKPEQTETGFVEEAIAGAEVADRDSLKARLLSSEQSSMVISAPDIDYSGASGSPFIETLLRQAPSEMKQRYRELMKQALAQDSKANDPVAVLKAVENLLPDGRHKEGLLRGLYETVIKSLASDNPRVQFALEQLSGSELGTGKSRPSLEKAKTLLEAGLQSNLSTAQYIEHLLNSAADEERDSLAEDLLFKFHPEKAESVLKLLSFSGVQEKPRHRQLLAAAALGSQEPETAEALAARAASQRADNWRREAKEEARQLIRLAAKLQAQSNPRARFLVDLADSRKSDGSLEIEDAGNAMLLYQAATEPNLSDRELLERVSEKSSGQEELRFIRRRIGRELFPEIAERASKLARYSPSEGENKVWDELFSAFLDQPDEMTPDELMQQAKGLYGSEKTFLQEALLEQQGAKNPRGRTVLELLETSGDEFRSDTVRALYEQALNPVLSESEFVTSALKNASVFERDRLRFLLAQEYFPKELEFIGSLTNESGTEQEEWNKQRALLLETALTMPGVQDLSRLVLRATESLGGRFGEGKTKLGLHKLALAKLALESPQAKVALEILSSDEKYRRDESRLAVSEAALSGVTDLEFLMRCTEKAYPDDQRQLVIDIGRWLLSDPKLQVPEGWLERLEAGEFSAVEVKELVETLRTASRGSSPKTDIETDENLIVIGHEDLEVDL